MDNFEPLRASLSRAYSFEIERAGFYRQFRNEMALKMRTGLIGLNGGSAVAVASAYGSMGSARLGNFGVGPTTIVFSLCLFVLGAWLAGWSLNAQYVDAINAEGDATTRAINFQMAVDWVDSEQHGEAVDRALENLRNTAMVRPNHDQWAIRFQSAAWMSWGAAAMALAISVAYRAIGPWLISALARLAGS